MRKARLHSVVFFLLLAVAQQSCVKSASSVQTSTSTTVPAFSFISVMNLAAYGDSANIYFNGSVYGKTYDIGSFSSSYFKLSSNIYDVQFKNASKDSLLADIPGSSFDSLGFYTIVLYNDSVNGIDKAAKIADNYSNIVADSAYYRFFNMCPDAPSIDLYINGTKIQANRTTADNIANPIFNNFQTFSTGYVTIEVKLSGSTIDLTSALTGTIVNGVYTIFLDELHKASGNQFSLELLQETY